MNINLIIKIIVKVVGSIPVISCLLDGSYIGLVIYIIIFTNVINPFINRVMSTKNRVEFIEE